MLRTAVGEATIPAPRISDEATVAQVEPSQLHVQTESGADYFFDSETRTVLTRQKPDSLFAYSSSDSPVLPELRVGQHYNPSNIYGLGSRIVAITYQQSPYRQPPEDNQDALSRMRETHVHARFLLDIAAAKTQQHE